ncbi:hypothetical protein GKZ92_23190 (plasmid) [Gordonia sp. 135]|uniref:hypothetical protein n=1 Tax=Gordonia sp. 135 TaxID=2676309 RepID=UPI0012BB4819|nr:hypothetical protein [Gordonia sp. 135]QGP90618.1 hypothetical protein GKZ92_23190 [Gordonia sp. 135]
MASNSEVEKQLWTVGICFVAVVAVAVAFLLWRETDIFDREQKEEVSTEVGQDGFSLNWTDSDGVEIVLKGGAGVAPAGTKVDASFSSNGDSAIDNSTLHAMFDPVGGSFTAVLEGGDIQPQSPVTISYRIPAEDGVSTGEVKPGNLQGFIQSADGSIQAAPVEATIERTANEEHLVYTFQTTHFSGFSLQQFNVAGFFNTAWDGVKEWFNVGGDKPDCVGKPATVGGTTYRIGTPRAVKDNEVTDEEDNSAYPCVSAKGNQLGVQLTAADSVSWKVRSRPAPNSSGIGEMSLESQIGSSLASALSNNDMFLLPGGELNMTYSAASVPGYVGMRIDPGPMLVMSAAYGLQQYFGMIGQNALDFAELFSDSYNILSCVTNEADAFAGGNGVDYIKAHWGCISGIMGDWIDSKNNPLLATGTALIGVVSGGIQLAWGQLTGVFKELFGNKLLYMEITQEGGSASSSPLFSSPAQTVLCEIGSLGAGTWGGRQGVTPNVGCVVDKTSYLGPRKDFTCNVAGVTPTYGAASLRKGDEPSQGVCTGGIPFNVGGGDPLPQFSRLAEGTSVKRDGFTCTSEGETMLCLEDSSGKGFRISIGGVELIGGDSTEVLATDRGIEDGPATTWERKGAKLNLVPDYTGTLYFNSGAANEREWKVTWKESGNRVTITVGDPIRSQGDMEQQLRPGDQITGTFSNGRMKLTDIPSTYGNYEVEICNPTALSMDPECSPS